MNVTSEELDLLPLAQEASRLLLDFYGPNRKSLATATKSDAYDLVTAADAAVQELCAQWLASRSIHPLLGEEGGADEGGDTFWSLDPLDGTREFVNEQGEYAFQLALVHQGLPVRAVVALPAYDTVYLATKDQGCVVLRLSDGLGLALPHEVVRRERLVLSRSLERREDLQRLVAGHPAQDRISFGGVGAKVHAILWGIGDTYLTTPEGMYGWDLAAPLLVAHECGLVACDLHGKALVVPSNREKVKQGILFTRARFLCGNLEYLRGLVCPGGND